MQVKTFMTTMGLGIAAGAATVLMLPKHSKAYQIADHTAQKIKRKASCMANKISH